MTEEPRPLGPLIDRLLGHLGAPPARVLSTLEGTWPEIAGPGLAAASRPIEVRDGTLVVACWEPAWAAQIRWMEADLCRRLSDRLEGVPITAVRVRHVADDSRAREPRW